MNSNGCLMVRAEGLEPTRIATLEPKSKAYIFQQFLTRSNIINTLFLLTFLLFSISTIFTQIALFSKSLSRPCPEEASLAFA